MQVLLVQPPFNFPSGGCLYNLKLLEQARRQNFPLTRRIWRGGELPPADLVFWDSLGLARLAHQALPQGAVHVLLLHFLPSLDPALSSAPRLALERLEREVLARFAHVLVTGPGLLEPLRRRELNCQIWVCEPGVGEEFLTPRRPFKPSATGREFLTVANLLPGKGYLELIQVWAKFKHTPWRWHWVGASSLDPRYARQVFRAVRRLGLSERIVYHGVLSPRRLVRLLDEVDWFLFPSRFESFGMALAEAAARRVPIISSRVGAAERWVIPGRTGWLLPPGDWRGFAQVLRHCLAAPKPCFPRRRVKGGFAPVLPTWEQVFARWREICLRLLESA
jgi:glycosyltransferase involved in cell wall biosynthesis